MGFISICIRNPAAVAVVVAILAGLGLMSVRSLPVQLFPDIERPRLGITTAWRAASPSEMEAEILEPLEDVLQGTPGLVVMRSQANAGFSWIEMEFTLDTDMDATVLDVLNRLNRVPPLPADADPPSLNMGGAFGDDANATLIYYFVQALPGNPRPIAEYRRFIEDYVIPRLEAVPGVGGVTIGNGGGSEAELQVVFDPFLVAEYGINIPAMATTIGRPDDVSGGFVNVGRRQYMLQFEGRFEPEDLGNLILEWRDGQPVRLSDVAEIRVGEARRRDFAYQNGNPAISLRILRDNNANVLSTINAVRTVIDEMREGPFAERQLDIQQSFDPSVFIVRAISLLTGNLAIGVGLAIGVLWLFLRRPRATFLIASTIPICLLTTFLVLDGAGRTINVISLAGLAFATGMVLDAAIVVLETIVRLREQGTDVEEASEKGASEVWGALLASTATTVAIFVPVIFIKDVEGQLFADLALTIAIAVTVSLIVALTVLPAGARYFVRQRESQMERHPFWEGMANRIMALTDTPLRRWLWIGVLIVGSGVGTWAMTPSLNYLPPVKRDAVDVWFNFPDGVTIDFIDEEVAQPIQERMEPFMEGTREPALRNYYVLGWPGGGTIGARVMDQSQVNELATIMRQEVLVGLPDTQAFAQQGNLFGGFDGDGAGVALHFKSADIEAIAAVALEGQRMLRELLPVDANVRVNPNPEPAQPELRIIPNDERILEGALSRSQMANIVRAVGNGLYLGEFFDGEQRLDIILRAEDWDNPDSLGALPIATPSGAVVPLSELVTIERTVGPASINRRDKRRTISLFISQPDGMSLQDVVTLIEAEVEPRLREMLPPDGAIRYGGSADALRQAVTTMSENFVLALVLLFLLMAALFRSLTDSLLVVIAIPLATVGGMGALRLLDIISGQPLDLLTMIGFIILLGLVVNNAILLVERTRRSEDTGLSRRDAVRESLTLRMRPIFMSTLTSIFGMLPLVLMPGAGSVIYRGLAATIVGGMAVSLIFTLILLPSLLRLGESKPRTQPGAEPSAS